MKLEIMRAEHIAEVARLEKLCFSSPWSENSLGMLLGEGGVAFVAAADGRVAAYGGMMTVLDEGQVTNIATHPDYRRQGYAREITEALIGYGREQALEGIYLEVRESNSAAIALYTACGFEKIGIRRGFYTKPAEAAVLMKLNLLPKA